MKTRHALRFLGGAGTVTGSKFLVSSGETRILVDCGLYQGRRDLRDRNWQDPPVHPSSLDAIVLTHAHIDHCGYLPRLVAAGFDGPVYATPATAELARIVLPDCGHLNEEEAEYANRKGYSRHEPALPLYTEDDAWAATQLLKPLDYGETLEIGPYVELCLSRAGHILGAASVRLNLADDGRAVAFSGDLGRASHPLLVSPDPPPAARFLLVESTYGDRRHDDVGSRDALAAAITRTIERGGNVLIPAFAVDRTEVILFHLADLARTGRLPDGVPVYVDSPMALSALEVYRRAIDDGDADVSTDAPPGVDPFAVPGLREVREVEESKALNHPDRPSIVISAAGMASGGRVVHHLMHQLPDARNSVILVGYQAEGTRGRRLAEGAEELKMMGRYVRVRAEIVDLPGFSVHADSAELLDWVAAAPEPPETVYVVHGEPQASAALASEIRRELDWSATVPALGELIAL
ncbi:MAG: MBL fold metallo-hydrolase RNA specificity domain-containing protein [Ilumatobacteraceae bacterium]